MKNKKMKIIGILICMLFMIMLFSNICYAAGDSQSPERFGANYDVDTDEIAKIGNSIATIIRNLGIVAAVIVLMLLGIKYMIGSAEEKADFKKSMIPYLIGTVLLFGASGIAQVFISVAKSI